jgi:hypothetical protein
MIVQMCVPVEQSGQLIRPLFIAIDHCAGIGHNKYVEIAVRSWSSSDTTAVEIHAGNLSLLDGPIVNNGNFIIEYFTSIDMGVPEILYLIVF